MKKRHLDHQSCPFVFKWEKQSMDSIKQICERSKWLQSLLPAPQILAFNDWIRPSNRGRAANPPGGSDMVQRVERMQMEK